MANVKEGAYIEAFVREVEVASAELIGAFYAVPPRRPAWANHNGYR